jgi:flagellar hook-basal body complex protein FliE
MSDFSVYNNIQKPMTLPPASPHDRGKSSGSTFGNVLEDAIQQVNSLETNTQTEIDKFLSDDTDVHSVMMALQKANISFQLMMQVRNKIVSAYQEIMKTQV